MKKLLLVFAASAVLFSCSKDDDKDTQNPNTNLTPASVLPGEWKMIGTKQQGSSSFTGGSMSWVTTGSNFKGTATFSTGPNTVVSNFGYDFKMEMSYEIMGQTTTQTVEQTIPQTPANNTWSINSAGQLTGFSTDPSANMSTMDITIISATEIVLTGVAQITQSVPGIGSQTADVDIETTLQKVQ